MIATAPVSARPAPTPGSVREVRHLTLVASEPAFVQGVLALTYPMPSGLETYPTGWDEPSPADATYSIPDPTPWAARYVQAVVEVLARQRPVSQLARWTAKQVYGDLVRRHRAAECARRDPDSRPARQSVVSVRVFSVCHGAAEVSARVEEGPRSRAVAARLDFHRGRWMCTALTVG